MAPEESVGYRRSTGPWTVLQPTVDRVIATLRTEKHLVDQAYDVILDALCDGTLRSGERITQEDIAARLNVSRQPVTHALAVLKSQGFLISSGRRGLTVAPVETKFFADIYQMRSVLEPLAVRLGCSRLSASAIVKGRSIVEHGRNMMIAGDARASLQADVDFHSFIYELSGNALIGESLKLHWKHLRRAMGEVLRFPGLSVSVWQEHGRIVEAMARGDGDAAADLMHKHIVSAAERVGLQGSPTSEADATSRR